MKLKFILECFIFQTETEFQEWMKEIKQSFQQAQVMMRAGAKIMSSGHRYITQYSKEENGPVSPWTAHSHANHSNMYIHRYREVKLDQAFNATHGKTWRSR